MDWLWGLVFGVSLCFCDAGKRTTSEYHYEMNFIEDVKSCNHFDNKVLDMSGLKVQYDTPLSTSLTGVIKVIKTIGDGDELERTEDIQDEQNANYSVEDNGLTIRPLEEYCEEGIIFDMGYIRETDIFEAVGSGYKEEGITGPEFMGMISGNVCKYIKDETAPWTPLFTAMGIDSCPIKAGTYPVESLKFNMNFTPVLNHQLVGEYKGILSLHMTVKGALDFEQKRQISCHEMAISIVESKVD